MNTWRMGACGHLHDWGICSGEHQVMDTEDVYRDWFPDGNPLMADMKTHEGDVVSAGSRQDVIDLLREHALSSSFVDGNVVCKCGHVCQLVWFAEHLVDKVGKRA